MCIHLSHPVRYVITISMITAGVYLTMVAFLHVVLGSGVSSVVQRLAAVSNALVVDDSDASITVMSLRVRSSLGS